MYWCDMSKQSIDECVRDSLETYFEDLRGIEPAGLYELILKAVEKPMLELVMDKAGHNQSRAAQWLGRLFLGGNCLILPEGVAACRRSNMGAGACSLLPPMPCWLWTWRWTSS